jgi:hypothetical protein
MAGNLTPIWGKSGHFSLHLHVVTASPRLSASKQVLGTCFD